jgi:hypothetical protein
MTDAAVLSAAEAMTRLGIMPHPAIVALKIIASMGTALDGSVLSRVASAALKALGETQ